MYHISLPRQNSGTALKWKEIGMIHDVVQWWMKGYKFNIGFKSFHQQKPTCDKKLFKNLNPKKTTQSNEILTKLIKEYGELLFPIIINHFNNSLEQDIVPEPKKKGK